MSDLCSVCRGVLRICYGCGKVPDFCRCSDPEIDTCDNCGGYDEDPDFNLIEEMEFATGFSTKDWN